MAKPTFNDILPGVEVINEVSGITALVNATNPAVVIPWSFFSAQGMDDVDSLDNPEGILAAILKAPRNFYRTDTTEQPNIEYDEPRPTIISRNGTNKLAWQYGITLYQSFAVNEADPDLIAAG